MKSLIIVIQFIFVLAFILPAADWHQTSYGKWVVESFENSPFPYSDMTDPAFQDSSVFIFIPDGYLQSAYFDLIVDHHGHGAIIDPQNNEKFSYPEKFRQAFQLYESRKNAILIIPQAARNKSSGAAGSFTEMNGFKNFIDEVTVYLKQQKIMYPEAYVRQIHISSFSGGYIITACDITRNHADFVYKIKSINLWDSFYGEQDVYFDWIFNKKQTFFSTYTPTGGTKSLNYLLIDSLKNSHFTLDTILNLSNKNNIIVQYTNRSHGDVANGEFSYAKYLGQLPLEDIDIRAPLLLAVIPASGITKIDWADQKNSHLAGYRLLISEDGDSWDLIAGENILTKQITTYSHSTNKKYHYRLQAISRSGMVLQAPFDLSASPGDTSCQILLVHAENKRLKDDVRGFNPDSFLHVINPDLVINISNFINKPYAACSNLAIRNGIIGSDQFDHVVWLGGEEDIRDKIIDHAEKNWITKFLSHGNNLLISGSGIPFDLASPFTSPDDRIFGETVAGVSGIDSIKHDLKNISSQAPFPEKSFNINTGFPLKFAFKHAILPVLELNASYTIGSLYKYETTNLRQNSTILILAFSLALCESPEFTKFILDQFFYYSEFGNVTPCPPKLYHEVYFTPDSIHLTWPRDTEQFVVTYFNTERSETDAVTYFKPPFLIQSFSNKAKFVRIRAQSGGLISRSSEMLGTSKLEKSEGRILIINGFDRVTGGNSFDFCIEHGLSLNQIGYDFDTATNEYVTSGHLDLNDYPIVDWILGEESTGSHTLTSEEQALIKDYLSNGGKIILSGAEIGWDLVEKATSPGDSIFFKEILGAKYLGDNAKTLGFVLPQGRSSAPDTLQFNGAYTVSYPDILAAGIHGDLLLEYDNGLGAAVGTRINQSGGSVLVAFPLETITPLEDRNRVFQYLIDYLRETTEDTEKTIDNRLKAKG